MDTTARPSRRLGGLLALALLASTLVAGTALAAHRNMRLLRIFSVNLAPTNDSLVVHEGLNKIYSADSDSITVVDGSTNEIIKTIFMPRQISRLAVNERTHRLYVAIAVIPRLEVHVIDALGDVVLGSFAVGGNPQYIAADSSRDLVLVGHSRTPLQPARVDIYDGTSWNFLVSIPLPQDSRGFVVDEPAGRAYALAQSSLFSSPPGSVVAIDTDALAPIAEIGVGDGAGDMALDPVRGRLYVTNGRDDTLSVIDTVALGTLATLAPGDGPLRVTVHVATGKVYVGNWSDRTVTAIDGETLETTATIALESRPEDLVAHPLQRRVYVAEGSWVRSIDPKNDRVASSVALRSRPLALRFNGPADRLWAGGFDLFVVGDRSDPFQPPF